MKRFGAEEEFRSQTVAARWMRGAGLCRRCGGVATIAAHARWVSGARRCAPPGGGRRLLRLLTGTDSLNRVGLSGDSARHRRWAYSLLETNVGGERTPRGVDRICDVAGCCSSFLYWLPARAGRRLRPPTSRRPKPARPSWPSSPRSRGRPWRVPPRQHRVLRPPQPEHRNRSHRHLPLGRPWRLGSVRRRRRAWLAHQPLQRRARAVRLRRPVGRWSP